MEKRIFKPGFEFIFSSYKQIMLVLFVLGVCLAFIRTTSQKVNAAVNNLPVGSFDGVDNNACSINGWTADPDDLTKTLPVHVYIDPSQTIPTGTFIGGYLANQARPDVDAAGYPTHHGFFITFSSTNASEAKLFDGLPHTVYVYGIDAQDTNQHTQFGPKTLTCPAVTPAPKPLIAGCDSFGDVDGDGKISTADQKMAFDILSGTNKTATALQKADADVDISGQVDISDPIRIGDYLNGTITTFPVCAKNTAKPLACGSLGDVNNDGKIDMTDLALMDQYFGTRAPFTPEQQRADVDGDNVISILDIGKMAAYGPGATFPACPVNKPPVGSFDGVDNNACSINGWTADPDDLTKTLPVHVYIDPSQSIPTGSFIGGYLANQARPDVDAAGYPTHHGFFITFSSSNASEAKLFDGKTHTVYVYGIDAQDTNQHTQFGPKTLTCQPTPTVSTCQYKSKGDANCDGKIDMQDFDVWKADFQWNAVPSHADEPHVSSDFNGDNKVDTDDFNIWRDGFLNTSLPH